MPDSAPPIGSMEHPGATGPNPAFPVRLSVVIPTYHRPRSLLQAVESLLPQLGPDDRLRVIEDDPDAPTAGMMGELSRVTFEQNEKNLGMVGNWNRCLSRAINPWICMVHDDDRIEPHALKHVREACARLGGPGMVVQPPWHTSAQGPLDIEILPPGPEAVLRGPFEVTGTTVHRQVLDELGLFREDLPYSPDFEFFARVSARFPTAIVRSPRLFHFVLHDDNAEYATWRAPNFLERFEQVQRIVIQHAGLTGQQAVDAFRHRIVMNLEYMLKNAARTRDAALFRHICQQARGRSYLGRRIRLKLHMSRWTGQPPNLTRA